MKTYGTTAAFTAIGVGRSQFRTWVDNKYIKPLTGTSGYGTKSEWTRNDIHTAALFKWLINVGLKRKVASEISTFYRNNIEQQSSELIIYDFNSEGSIMVNMEKLRKRINLRLED